MKILHREQLESIIHLDKELIECMRNAFYLYATKKTEMPPIMSLDIQEANGEVDIKSAYIEGIDRLCVKIGTGFFNNPKLGLPTSNGLMILLSSKTGQVEALLLDEGYLTDLRTAATGALAIDLLKPSNSKKLGIIGTGAQSRYQLLAAKLVQDFTQITVWGRNPEKVVSYIEWANKLGIQVQSAQNCHHLCNMSDIVITTTPSTTPLISKDMLHQGMLIIAMGSDSVHKNEIDPNVFDVAHYVCDIRAQTEILGELSSALKKGTADINKNYAQLGQIIAGSELGRTQDSEIILCDLTGTGIQDTAIANHVFLKLS